VIAIDSKTQLLTNAECCLSPNFNERPEPLEINLLIVHGISLPAGEFEDRFIRDLFLNRLDCNAHHTFNDKVGLEVSSHLLILRNGSIVQFVPFDKRAWHAGLSEFQGRANCNDYSIGVELVGADDIKYTKEQYDSLSKVTQLLLNEYPKITLDRIVGHSDVAPGRKTDPGAAFDWCYFKNLLTKDC
jgi:N-acetyl-anhydromuramoyl-L-alanine amidase